MKTMNRLPPDVRERAMRLVSDNQGQHGSHWQAVLSISPQVSCAPQTLNIWVNRTEADSGTRVAVSGAMTGMKALERANHNLRQATEVLRKASASFAMIEGSPASLRALPEMLDRRSE